MPAHTFAKLPVCTLINDPQKNWYRHQLQPMAHFFTNHKFDLLSYIYIINFLNLPVHALIHDLQKKILWASTRTHDPFSDNPKIWPTFIYRGEVPAHTFAKLPVRALIHDPKKLFLDLIFISTCFWPHSTRISTFATPLPHQQLYLFTCTYNSLFITINSLTKNSPLTKLTTNLNRTRNGKWRK